jgi:hypothetical protein
MIAIYVGLLAPQDEGNRSEKVNDEAQSALIAAVGNIY